MTSKSDLTSSVSSEGDSIKVFLRVRPPENGVGGTLPISGRVVEVNNSTNSVTLLAKPDPKIFTFDYVADSLSTQESVFSAVGKSLIESCVAGYNGTIFAYGQTGSGKTFTMLGPSEECDNFKHEQRGVIPRSFEHLFNLINREQELHGDRKQFLTKCSFLEIYQEQVYDLLDPATANLQLRENIKKGVFVDGLTEQVVTTPTEAYQALSTGWLNRKVAATSMNRESSRSHAVFTLCIESKEEKNGVKNVRESQLNLVDLAGSERQKDTNTVGIRLKEAGKINQSLSVLGNVIMSLVKIAQGRPQHIPYRDSKLTFLLRDSLGGNARTSIVACVHPDAKCFGETLSTLNFAKRAKQIKNKAVINEDTQGNVAHLQAEIRRLRDMMAQLQAGALPPAVPGDGEGPSASQVPSHAPCQGSNSAQWRNRFLEAMLFREKGEQEKEGLRDQVRMLEEDRRKKERMVQSSRLIIKLRESTIAKLEKAAKGAGAAGAEDPVNKQLCEDVASLKARLDQYPQVSQMDQQLHSLRAQLTDARIRLGNTTASLLDSNRLADLENTFQELQAASRQESAGSSPQGADSRTSASLHKLREKLDTLEKENEQLKKERTEERQGRDSREARLQAELTATRTMNTELERLLEANHLKHRLHNDALTSLHNNTIKALTPTRNTYDLRTRTVVCSSGKGDSRVCEEQSLQEDDIFMEAPPPALLDNAHEVLTDEIKTLQQSNSSLQERLNEYEADIVRLRQQINQLQLEKDSVTQILSKERSEGAEKQGEQDKALRDMKSTIETLTADLSYAKDESQDYRLLLQSSDRELKAEKDKVRAHTCATQHRINTLETQLLQVQFTMENLGKQLEEESKEREVMEEKVEMERMEKVFLQEQMHTLETALTQQSQQCHTAQDRLKEAEARLAAEKEEQQRLQERSQQFGQQEEQHQREVADLRDRLQDLTRDCEEKRNQLDTMATQLHNANTTSASLQRDLNHTQEALQQQVQRVQELKMAVQESEDRSQVLQDLTDSRSAELADARQQWDVLKADLQASSDQLAAAAVQKEMLNEDLAFYQEQNEKAVEECESLRQNLDAVEEMKEKLQKEIQSLQAEVEDRDKRLQQTTKHLEEVQAQRVASPVASPDRPSVDCSLYPLTFTVLGHRLWYIAREHVYPCDKELCEVDLNQGYIAREHVYPCDKELCEVDLNQGTVQESRLAAMVEELTRGRDQWMEENTHLKGEVELLRMEMQEKKDLSKRCQDLQCQLDNQNIVFKDSIQQLQELHSADQAEAQVLRESLAEAHRQHQSALTSTTRLTAQCEEAQSERQHAEEELSRLKGVLEKSYREKDQLQSEVEVMREVCRKTKQELAEADQRSQELAEFNAVLAGHANHAQKISYMKRLQTDYNSLKDKYEELAKENFMLQQRRLPTSPLKDRTNAPC
ncbi:kinesin-like protein KIF15 [Babylonia areolata]|uniref:kinesin-like protein KIF15 n=1 Tax=Babylonia areolata TaxID=304850 RepID=UPI003FD4CDCE